MGSEIWKNIVGFEGLYKISNLGRVKSLYHIKSKKMNVEVLKLKQTNGYYFVDLCKNKKKFSKRIHRLVAEAFIPNPENKPWVNHKNGVKTDNTKENLEWVTPSENLKHAYKNGLRESGKFDDC